MTELERCAVALLQQWRAEGGADGQPIGVSALLDRVFPYRVARRVLGIDASEDYEALILRLLAEEEDLVRVEPVDAADMARATIGSRLPDLDVLQLLRSASLVLTERTVARLGSVPLSTPAKEESKWADAPPPVAMMEAVASVPAEADHPAEPAPAAESVSEAAACWSCAEALPGDRAAKFCPFCGADQREPACPACGAMADRKWKHCPECGTKLRGA